MYFLYSLGGVTFNKPLITLSVLNCYSPNFQGFILMKNALNNQVGMLGDMFLWLVANLKQGVIYFIKQALPPNKSAGSVLCQNRNLRNVTTRTVAFITQLHRRILQKNGIQNYILLGFNKFRSNSAPCSKVKMKGRKQSQFQFHFPGPQ